MVILPSAQYTALQYAVNENHRKSQLRYTVFYSCFAAVKKEKSASGCKKADGQAGSSESGSDVPVHAIHTVPEHSLCLSSSAP